MAQAQPTANTSVSQEFVHATDDEKDKLLWTKLCELPEGSRVIVFANTKRRVDMIAKTFAEFGTCAIHGDKAQVGSSSYLYLFICICIYIYIYMHVCVCVYVCMQVEIRDRYSYLDIAI